MNEQQKINETQKKIKKRRRKRQDVYLIWEYYHKIQLTTDSPVKCVCKFCNRVYLCHMKRLLNHLVGSCKKCPEHIKTYMKTLEKKIVAKKREDDTRGKEDNKNEENVEEYTAIEEIPIGKNKKCFVYGCHRTIAEFSFFPAPKEVRDRVIWNSIITHPFQQRNLRATDFICERHFAPSDVLRYLVVNGVRIPNKSPVLRRNCLPIKFFDDYVLKSYNHHITKLISTISEVGTKRKRVNSDDQLEQILESRNEKGPTNIDVFEELALNPEFEIVLENEKNTIDFTNSSEIPDIQNEEIIIKTEPNEDISLADSHIIDIPNIDFACNMDVLIKPEIGDMDLCVVKDEISDDSDSSEDEDIENNFFERIYETKSFPDLDDHWAICPYKNFVKPILQNLVSENKSVVFTQMKVKDGIPITDKQILLTEDLKIEYFVGHNKCMELYSVLSEVSNTADLAMTINRFSALISCEGGPEINEQEIGVQYAPSTYYYKDYSTRSWRHKQCIFLSESGSVCMHCKYVKKYFKRKAQKNQA